MIANTTDVVLMFYFNEIINHQHYETKSIVD